MTKTEQVRKELQKLLKEDKIKRPYNWVSKLIRFSFDGEDVEFLTCLEDQSEMAFQFLFEKEPDFILIEDIGRVSMAYNWPMPGDTKNHN